MADWNAEAEKCVRAAEKRLKGSFFGNLLGSKSERAEAALEDYKQALDNFKLAKNWPRCREVNAECAALCLQANEPKEAASFSAEAGDFAMKAGDRAAAVDFYKSAAETHKRSGAFDLAAQTLRKIGAYFEQEEEPLAAAGCYREAAELFALAKYHATDAAKLQVKVADLLARMADEESRLQEAIALYEAVAAGHLANNLLRFNAKDLLVKAVVVFLLLEDEVGAQKSLKRYCGMDPSLASAFESKFLAEAIDACARKSGADFDAACHKLMKRATLEEQLQLMLEKVRERLARAGGDVANDADPL